MIFLWALLVRLIFMPTTMHSDLLFTNYFPYFLSQHGVWDIYGYFGDHYLQQGHTYYAPLIYYLTGLAQWVLRPFNPGFDEFMNHAHELMYSGSVGPIGDYLSPFSLFQRLRFVFMMKLPYLAADALCIILIAKIFTSEQEKRRALILWLFSPVLIFSIYIFGTYRIYPALTVWYFIYLIQKDKKVLAAFIFGALCLMDSFPWILMAPVFLALGRDWRERVRLGFTALGIFGAVFGALYVSSHGFVKYAYISPVLKKAAFQSLTNHFALSVTLVAKSVFLALYFLILIKLFRARRAMAFLTSEKRAELIVCLSAAILFIFYATSQTLAHYFMWILPFFVILQAKGEPWRPSLSWILIGLLFLFNLDKRTLNLGLLMPLDPVFFLSVPSLHEVMDRWLPWGKVVGAGRLLFSFLCLIFAWDIFKIKVNPLLENNSQIS